MTRPDAEHRVARSTLRVLGSAQLVDAEGMAVALPAKALALLTYLRIATTRRAHRAFLADLLWSEVDEEKGRASLRQAVMAIRQALGDGALVPNGQDLHLVAPLGCDADEFVTLASRGEYAAAVELYRGDFFLDFALPGARSYELWATIERERQRGIFLRAADAATQQLLDAGRARAAGELAARLITADDARERSWRLRLDALLMLGDLAAARKAAESMRAVLNANDVELEPATEKLLLRLQRTDAPVTGSGEAVLRAELVGRTRAFSALLDAWKSLGTAGLSVRALIGDAGLGKTRLLEELATRLRSLGARVVRVDARYGDQEIPYALLQQLVEALVALSGAAGIAPESARTLVALEPRIRSVFEMTEPEAVGDTDLPLRRSTALADLLGAVSDDRAIALLVDDVHWADHASLQTLFAAAARNRQSRVLLVVAHRPCSLPAFSGDEIALAALDAGGTRELVESIRPLGDVSWADALAGHLAAAARGVPLLLLEAIRLLEQEALLVRGDAAWECRDPDALLARLRTLDVLHERLARLDDEMRGMLLRVALAGGELRDTLLAAPGRSEGIEGTLRRLIHGGWVVGSAGRVAVRHAEIARTAIESSSSELLRTERAALTIALGGAPSLSDAEWRLQARLALEEKAFASLSAVIDRWIAADPRSRNAATWRGAVNSLLGGLASDDDVRALARFRPWRERIQSASWRVPAYAALLAGAVGAAGFVRHQSTAPVGLRFVSPPISGTTIGMTPQLAVEFVNRAGDRIAVDGDTVALIMQSRSARLAGDLREVARDGVAVFPNVRISGDSIDAATFIVAKHGKYSTKPARLLTPADATVSIERLQLLDGRTASLRGDTLVVLSGTPAQVQLTARYTAPWSAANIWFAAVPTWPGARTRAIDIGPAATPMVNGTRFTTFSFLAPATPGRYRIFLIMAAESDAAHIASATNWAVGAPAWNDGNDIADWGEAEAAEARRTGHLAPRNWLYSRERGGGRPTDLGVAVIDVLVTRAPVGDATPAPPPQDTLR